MYRYDEFDADLVRARTAQFAEQVKARLAGQLTEAEFKPLRLMNGLYLQLHAYMLRVAIPYGSLDADKMRRLAHVARTYDRGYGHFTTRQNIQFNWVKLVDTPQILAALAEVEMHAIQTSGNCIRNTTTDQFAGAASDEQEDPRPWCELIRQWSTLHPEFSFLPRKFKIAVTGAEQDRAAIRVHDIGLQMRAGPNKSLGFEVIVGGGQGRTPHIGVTIREFLPQAELLGYLEAIMRVYNRYGRRDNKYKARIKILVNEIGADAFRQEVEAEYAARPPLDVAVTQDELDRIAAYFHGPALPDRSDRSDAFDAAAAADRGFARWARVNTRPHKYAGYVSVIVSLKPVGRPPGDASAEQMDAVADLAERFGHNDIRVGHDQNLVLPHIAKDDLPAVYQGLVDADLATPNFGLISDIIACPGLDYCDLANARSIPIAQTLSETFQDMDAQEAIGPLQIKISGCINACGHHHVGHIGVLGVDKKGEEFYQITFGGRADNAAAIGRIAGRAMSADELPDAFERVIARYLKVRAREDETFVDTLDRLGDEPFKEALYAAH